MPSLTHGSTLPLGGCQYCCLLFRYLCNILVLFNLYHLVIGQPAKLFQSSSRPPSCEAVTPFFSPISNSFRLPSSIFITARPSRLRHGAITATTYCFPILLAPGESRRSSAALRALELQDMDGALGGGSRRVAPMAAAGFTVPEALSVTGERVLVEGDDALGMSLDAGKRDGLVFPSRRFRWPRSSLSITQSRGTNVPYPHWRYGAEHVEPIGCWRHGNDILRQFLYTGLLPM